VRPACSFAGRFRLHEPPVHVISAAHGCRRAARCGRLVVPSPSASIRTTRIRDVRGQPLTHHAERSSLIPATCLQLPPLSAIEASAFRPHPPASTRPFGLRPYYRLGLRPNPIHATHSELCSTRLTAPSAPPRARPGAAFVTFFVPPFVRQADAHEAQERWLLAHAAGDVRQAHPC
jgi:hypothetical protein